MDPTGGGPGGGFVGQPTAHTAHDVEKLLSLLRDVLIPRNDDSTSINLKLNSQTPHTSTTATTLGERIRHLLCSRLTDCDLLPLAQDGAVLNTSFQNFERSVPFPKFYFFSGAKPTSSTYSIFFYCCRRVKILDQELLNFVNAVRQLGSSIGLTRSAKDIRRILGEVKTLFQDNADRLVENKFKHDNMDGYSPGNTHSLFNNHARRPAFGIVFVERIPSTLGNLAKELRYLREASLEKNALDYLICSIIT